MTAKNEMSQGADDKADVGSTEKTQDKKTSADNAYKASAVHKNEKKSGMLSSMLLTILLALAVVIFVAYYYMPDKFNQYLSFSSASESEASTESDASNEAAAQSSSGNQGFVPTAPAANYASNNQMQMQQADWAAQQRADFDKRRAEFQKRRADSRPQQWQSSTPAEPPQWVKERQAEMEKQRAQYMKEMSEQQAKWEENFKRNQMNQMNQMNPYQQNAANNQPYNYNAQRPVMPYPQNQQYNPANQPPPQNYYRQPAYNYAPYYAPYGWQGNGYR